MTLFQSVYNVGEIILRKNEKFWIIPREHMFNEKNVYSPWFYYMGEKWYLVKRPYENSKFTFCLWRKIRSSLPKYEYIIQLSLKTTCRNYSIQSTGIASIDPDYGYEIKFGIHCTCSNERFPPNLSQHFFSQNGLVKLFFKIEKQKNNFTIDNSNNEVSNEDEERNSDEDDSEDEESEDRESNEDDESSDNEENSNDSDTSINKTAEIEAEGTKKLAENLKQVLLDGRMSDVVLKVDNHEFNVHKVILVARSSVFASMFEHDLTEKNTNVVDIPDCTAESFKIFLNYLYSGQIENLSIDNVYNVYYAADKYHIDDLKEKCVTFMRNNLAVETFCDFISLSLRHEENKLQKAAVGFFCKNIKKIVKNVHWQKYMAENPTHANELLIKALKA